MDLARFRDITGRLKEGDTIHVVQEDPSNAGFYRDIETGAKLPIRQCWYFSSLTTITAGEPGISVTQGLHHGTGRCQPPYTSLSYKTIIELIVPER